LCTSIDHTVLFPVDAGSAEVRTHVGDENLTFWDDFIREIVHGETLDGFVTAVMEIFGVFFNVPLGWIGDSRIFGCFVACNFVGLAIFSSFLDGSSRPRTSGQVVTSSVRVVDWVLTQEVVADSRELHRCSTLEEINLEIVGHVKKGSGVFHRLFSNRSKSFTSVGHFHDGHTSAIPVKELVLRLLEYSFGENTGTGTKIPNLLTKGFCGILDQRLSSEEIFSQHGIVD
jgi:hypothetical protein